MKTNNIFQLLVVLISQFVLGQTVDSKKFYGKITYNAVFAEGVNAVNLTTERATSSDKNGLFFLFAKEGDIIVLSAVNLVTLRRRVEKQDLLSTSVEIQMTAESIALKEVVINGSTQISAENLGIIPLGQKKYTPAERKLYTAISGGGIDGLLNAISGRKAMLKKEIATEYKEQMLIRLDNIFSTEYYTETLSIPQEYIRGFQYYCVEDRDLVASLNSRNKTLSQFLIIILAKKYNKTIADEN